MKTKNGIKSIVLDFQGEEMTNEEAILYLQAYKTTSDSAQVHTALDMAIKALESDSRKKNQ